MQSRGLLRRHTTILAKLSGVFDALAIALAGLSAYVVRVDEWWPIPANYLTAILVSVSLLLLVFSYLGIYQSWRGRSLLEHVRLIAIGWLIVVLLLVAGAFVTKTGNTFSRLWLGTWVVLGLFTLLLFRTLAYQILKGMRRKGWNHKAIVIVGAGELGQWTAQHLADSPEIGLEVVAFFDDKPELAGTTLLGAEVRPLATLKNYLGGREVDEVWLALPIEAQDRVEEILHDLRDYMRAIRFVPQVFAFRLLQHQWTEVGGIPLLDISSTPMLGLNKVAKALEDRVLAATILFVMAPVLCLIAVLVKLSSPGSILFTQMRHGWDGRAFKIYKFRTMVVHEESENKLTQATKNDLRFTKIGWLLRRTSLDELPQLINVLKGNMSIVGPRPHAIEHSEQYRDRVEAYMQRHKVKPGITGWAQVNGLRGETAELDKMKKRVEYDLYYIENWSVWFDLRIIFLTLVRGFIHENAH